jgi:hypothetical protein
MRKEIEESILIAITREILIDLYHANGVEQSYNSISIEAHILANKYYKTLKKATTPKI